MEDWREMKLYNEYETRNGLPFYSDWAFTRDADKMHRANMEALAEYDGRYCRPRYDQSVEDCIAENPDKLVYEIDRHDYGSNSYVIKSNPENLKVEEIALIVDNGNLCFGFSGSQYRVNIYID